MHSHGRERRGDLECPANAEPPDLRRAKTVDELAVEAYLTRVRRDLATQHIEAGRLSGAVGANDCNHLARINEEGDVVHRFHATKGLPDGSNSEFAGDTHGASPTETRLEIGMRRHTKGQIFWSIPTMPRGKNMMASTITTPRGARQNSVVR